MKIVEKCSGSFRENRYVGTDQFIIVCFYKASKGAVGVLTLTDTIACFLREIKLLLTIQKTTGCCLFFANA
jgi:hypothetical protein